MAVPAIAASREMKPACYEDIGNSIVGLLCKFAVEANQTYGLIINLTPNAKVLCIRYEQQLLYYFALRTAEVKLITLKAAGFLGVWHV